MTTCGETKEMTNSQILIEGYSEDELIEWIVYAINCTEPNPKLSRVLDRLGFAVRQLDNGSEGYWLRVSTNDTLLRRHSG